MPPLARSMLSIACERPHKALSVGPLFVFFLSWLRTTVSSKERFVSIIIKLGNNEVRTNPRDEPITAEIQYADLAREVYYNGPGQHWLRQKLTLNNFVQWLVCLLILSWYKMPLFFLQLNNQIVRDDNNDEDIVCIIQSDVSSKSRSRIYKG